MESVPVVVSVAATDATTDTLTDDDKTPPRGRPQCVPHLPRGSLWSLSIGHTRGTPIGAHGRSYIPVAHRSSPYRVHQGDARRLHRHHRRRPEHHHEAQATFELGGRHSGEFSATVALRTGVPRASAQAHRKKVWEFTEIAKLPARSYVVHKQYMCILACTCTRLYT